MVSDATLRVDVCPLSNLRDRELLKARTLSYSSSSLPYRAGGSPPLMLFFVFKKILRKVATCHVKLEHPTGTCPHGKTELWQSRKMLPESDLPSSGQ